MTNKQKWLATLRWLRRNFPVELPVHIRSLGMKDCGDTTYSEGMKDFRVRIKANQPLSAKLDTVMHEHAHVLTWFGSEAEIEDHGAEWGIAYARIYRMFLEWDFGRAQKKKTNGPLPGQREFEF